MKIYISYFRLIDVKVSCSSMKMPSPNSSFSFGFADEKPLSQEHQSQLRSKYLFDDNEEDTKTPKRNMMRSQSLSSSRNPPEKTNNTFLNKNQRNSNSTRKYNLKIPSNSEKQNNVYLKNEIESGNVKVSNCLPPKCPISPVNKKEISFSMGTY